MINWQYFTFNLYTVLFTQSVSAAYQSLSLSLWLSLYFTFEEERVSKLNVIRLISTFFSYVFPVLLFLCLASENEINRALNSVDDARALVHRYFTFFFLLLLRKNTRRSTRLYNTYCDYKSVKFINLRCVCSDFLFLFFLFGFPLLFTLCVCIFNFSRFTWKKN